MECWSAGVVVREARSMKGSAEESAALKGSAHETLPHQCFSGLLLLRAFFIVLMLHSLKADRALRQGQISV